MGFYFNITFVKKYLFGFTSPEEEAELFSNSEVNGRMAEVWDNFSDLKSKETHPDSDKMFQIIKDQAKIPDKQIYRVSNTDMNRTKWYKSSIAIAASILILVLFGIFGFYFYNKLQDNYIEVISEKGQRKEFTLPDGTRVWLNADTKIKYRKNFNNVREVILWGEAYFSVVKNASKPFVVKTSKLDIKVLGTVFNVKSYPGDNTIETTLVTGLVSIEKNTGKQNEKEAPVLVKPKQKAVFNLSAEEIQVEAVNIDKTTSWKNGKLVIDNESIDGVLTKLQRWYGVKVELIGKNRFTEDRYTFTVKDENIEEVIHLLQLTSGITFKIEDLDGTHQRIYEPTNTTEEIIEITE